MGLADLVEVEQERVDVVQRADALVQRRHDGHCVLGQFRAVGLLVSRRQVVKLFEQSQQLLVFLKQSKQRGERKKYEKTTRLKSIKTKRIASWQSNSDPSVKNCVSDMHRSSKAVSFSFRWLGSTMRRIRMRPVSGIKLAAARRRFWI